MNFVIPMAGAGSRFAKEGYQTPKPLLMAHGKTLLEWSVDSLPLELCSRLIFIGLKEHENLYGLESTIRALYETKTPEIHFLWLDEVTRGQAETVYLARDFFDLSQPLVIYNIDTAFSSPTLKETLLNACHDGVLGAFESREPRFSYAALDDQGLVVRVVEKEPISAHALTGLYTFTNPSDFIHAFVEALNKNELVKGEFYVAPLYQKLIGTGGKFVIDEAADLWILGTPEEYRAFLDLPIKEMMS